MTQIIGFGHRKRTGKDTCARFLVTELRTRYKGISIVKLGFADKVKDVAYQIFGWAGLMPGEFYEEPQNAHLREEILPLIGKTPRQLWIGVGNGVRQACGLDDAWLLYALKHNKADVLIFKDLRFPAEADGILAEGGAIYRIDCPWAPVVTDGADDPLQEYDRWTGIIHNNERDNQRHLHSQVMEIIKRHFS